MNALDFPVECTTSNGVERLPLIQVIRQAERIIDILPHDRDGFAVFRFIQALCTWANPSSFCPVKSFDFLSEKRSYFDLFGEKRFLQDDPKGYESDKIKPVGYLLEEIPTGVNANYIYGVNKAYDKLNYGLCGECCLRGILRIAPWIGFGGRGFSPSINGSSMIYAVPLGSNLAETLRINWVTTTKDDKPCWVSTDNDKVGVIQAMTWNARSIYLRRAQEKQDKCYFCGKTDFLVRSCYYENGRKPPKKNTWKDPHLLTQAGSPMPPVARQKVSIDDIQLGRYLTKSILQEINARDSSKHIINQQAQGDIRLAVTTRAIKQAKIFNEYYYEIVIPEAARKDPKFFIAAFEKRFDKNWEMPEGFSISSECELKNPKKLPQPRVDPSSFIARLRKLTSSQLSTIREAGLDLYRDRQAYELFANLWRKCGLLGKRLPLTAAIAFSHYPVIGSEPISLKNWTERPGDEAFLDRLLTEVQRRKKAGKPINWYFLVQDLYTTTGVVRP